MATTQTAACTMRKYRKGAPKGPHFTTTSSPGGPCPRLQVRRFDRYLADMPSPEEFLRERVQREVEKRCHGCPTDVVRRYVEARTEWWGRELWGLAHTRRESRSRSRSRTHPR